MPGWYAIRLRSICGIAIRNALACKGISGNLIDILRLNFRQFAQSEEYFTTYSGYDLPLQTASKSHRGSVTSLTFVFIAYLCIFSMACRFYPQVFEADSSPGGRTGAVRGDLARQETSEATS